MYRHQPAAHKIDQMMQRIRIRNAINGRIDSHNKEKGICDVPRPSSDAGDHLAAGEGFDEDEVGHYG